MTKIKCRKCGKVYPFDEKICPICGYDIREDPNLSGRDRAALGLGSGADLFAKHNKETMERWQSQSRDERLKDAWDHHNSFEIRPDQGGIPRLSIPLNTMLFLTVIMIIVVIAMRFL